MTSCPGVPPHNQGLLLRKRPPLPRDQEDCPLVANQHFNSPDIALHVISFFIDETGYEERSWLPSHNSLPPIQRYAATLCQFLIFRIFKSFFQHHLYPPCCWSSSCSRSHRILKCVALDLVFFRASPDVAEPSQSVTSDDLSIT
ncbi:uncharacterized protein TNCV_1414851 [Trichonephila clavipes]|nr:uncharacterized protein TNCV_1414851 [Trichonephila clavipes]